MEHTADIPIQANHNAVDSKPAQIRTISEVFEPNSAEYAAWNNVNQEKAPTK